MARRRLELEHIDQVEIVGYADSLEWKYPELEALFAIPNAGKRGRKMAYQMVKEGLEKGMPDLCLPVSCWGYHALYLETKREANKVLGLDRGIVTPDQRKKLILLNSLGNLAIPVWGAEEGKKALLGYVSWADWFPSWLTDSKRLKRIGRYAKAEHFHLARFAK